MTNLLLDNLKKDLNKLANPKKAKAYQRFFKTGKGEYGEDDIFLGITVPESRIIAKKYKDLSLAETEKLLRSKIHEERVIAVMILKLKYSGGDEKYKKKNMSFILKES